MFPNDLKQYFSTGVVAPSYTDMGQVAGDLSPGLLLGNILLAFLSLSIMANIVLGGFLSGSPHTTIWEGRDRDHLHYTGPQKKRNWFIE